MFRLGLSLGGTGGPGSSLSLCFGRMLLGEDDDILRPCSSWICWENPDAMASRLDFLGGCCCTGLPRIGEVISNLGLMTSSAPGPPPASLNCSIMLCISDLDPLSCSSSLAYLLSSYPVSDLVGELAAPEEVGRERGAALEGARDGGWDEVGVGGVGST